MTSSAHKKDEYFCGGEPFRPGRKDYRQEGDILEKMLQERERSTGVLPRRKGASIHRRTK